MQQPVSNPPLLLDAGELEAVTGFRLASRQITWLQKKGWRFEVNGARKPVVARRYAEKMLGCDGADVSVSCLQPNFAALKVA